MYLNMDYIYLFENHTKQNKDLEYIYDNINNYEFIYILCYHITNTTKYPFLQFMMEKIPFCNNFIKEQFTLPFVLLNKETMNETELVFKEKNIEEMIIDKVKNSLKNIGFNDFQLSPEMYHGIFTIKSKLKKYALVNITGIDISGLNLHRNNLTWFVLPSEIINTKSICNIYIDEEITDLFTTNPHISLLTDPKTSQTYILPDVAYTGGEYKNVEFYSIFGNVKSIEYDSCGEYYYFFRSFKDALKYGGWIKNGGTQKIDVNDKKNTHNLAGRLIVDNDYGRYINGGINRYALFIEGNIHIETNSQFSLNDDSIKETTILICYSDVREIKPDILINNYENFTSLSYHMLNPKLLNDEYIICNSGLYMIM